jgi:DNA-directed RNA polymerase subunit RPC12/RpoP
MECAGCNREFEVVEISCSFVDEDMKETVECPTCGMAMTGRPGKIYISDPVPADPKLSLQDHPNGR